MFVHQIDCNMISIKSSALCCPRLKGFHTFDKIAELLIDIHSEYDQVLLKMIKIVTGNVQNMVKTLKVYKKPCLETDTFENNKNYDEDDDGILLLLKNFLNPKILPQQKDVPAILNIYLVITILMKRDIKIIDT